MFVPLEFVLIALAIIVQTGPCIVMGVLQESQAKKCAGVTTFLLNDRMFTCSGHVTGVKACGYPNNTDGIHFYLSLYASSNDSGSTSILFPKVVRTLWGLAGDVVWKPVSQRRTSNTHTNSRYDMVHYSKGQFLGVTIDPQIGVESRCSLPVIVTANATEVACDDHSPLRMLVMIKSDCYHNLVLRNDPHNSVVTPTPSLETTDMMPTGESSSTAGLIAGIVILLVGLVVETALCGIVWLLCWQRVLKRGTCVNGSVSAHNIVRRRMSDPGIGGEPTELETLVPSVRFSALQQRDEQGESQEVQQQQQYEGYETMATDQSAVYVNASAALEVRDKEDYWSPGESVTEVYSQMTLKRFVVIPGQSVQLGQFLGEGEYGTVYKGTWSSPNGMCTSAVKILGENATEEDRVKLLQEGAIMGQFCHPNVIKLHGVVRQPDPVMLVMEYLPGGDLRRHLLRTKELMDASVATGTYQELAAFCSQIASGMAYLSAKGFVHRDLAARNILLDQEHHCKIADFGMSRNVDKDAYYKTKGGMIPVKWTAPEAVLYRKYTTKSDVWSYGMVMYEIWSLGHKPFEGFSVEEIIKSLSENYCQPPPPGCPRGIYSLMVHCWNPSHAQRPSFTFLMRELKRNPDNLLRVEPGHAHLLGAPLEVAKDLYLDLQQMYTV